MCKHMTKECQGCEQLYSPECLKRIKNESDEFLQQTDETCKFKQLLIYHLGDWYYKQILKDTSPFHSVYLS